MTQINVNRQPMAKATGWVLILSIANESFSMTTNDVHCSLETSAQTRLHGLYLDLPIGSWLKLVGTTQNEFGISAKRTDIHNIYSMDIKKQANSLIDKLKNQNADLSHRSNFTGPRHTATSLERLDFLMLKC